MRLSLADLTQAGGSWAARRHQPQSDYERICSAAFSAWLGVPLAMITAAFWSMCLPAAIDAVLCSTVFSVSLLNHFAPPNPSMRALATSPVEKVNAGVAVPKMVIAFAAPQEPTAASAPTSSVPRKPGWRMPFSTLGKWSPLSPINTFTKPPAAPQTITITIAHITSMAVTSLLPTRLCVLATRPSSIIQPTASVGAAYLLRSGTSPWRRPLWPPVSLHAHSGYLN